MTAIQVSAVSRCTPAGLANPVAVLARSLVSPMPMEHGSPDASRTRRRSPSARVSGSSVSPPTNASSHPQHLERQPGVPQRGHHPLARRARRRGRRAAGTRRRGTAGPRTAGASRRAPRRPWPRRRRRSRPGGRRVGSPSPPTTSGRPTSSGCRRNSTDAWNWSRSTCNTHSGGGGASSMRPLSGRRPTARPVRPAPMGADPGTRRVRLDADPGALSRALDTGASGSRTDSNPITNKATMRLFLHILLVHHQPRADGADPAAPRQGRRAVVAVRWHHAVVAVGLVGRREEPRPADPVRRGGLVDLDRRRRVVVEGRCLTSASGNPIRGSRIGARAGWRARAGPRRVRAPASPGLLLRQRAPHPAGLRDGRRDPGHLGLPELRPARRPGRGDAAAGAAGRAVQVPPGLREGAARPTPTARRCSPRRWPGSRTGAPRTDRPLAGSPEPRRASPSSVVLRGSQHPGVAERVRLDVRQVEELGDAPVVGAAELRVRLVGQVELARSARTPARRRTPPRRSARTAGAARAPWPGPMRCSHTACPTPVPCGPGSVVTVRISPRSSQSTCSAPQPTTAPPDSATQNSVTSSNRLARVFSSRTGPAYDVDDLLDPPHIRDLRARRTTRSGERRGGHGARA